MYQAGDECPECGEDLHEEIEGEDGGIWLTCGKGAFCFQERIGQAEKIR